MDKPFYFENNFPLILKPASTARRNNFTTYGCFNGFFLPLGQGEMKNPTILAHPLFTPTNLFDTFQNSLLPDREQGLLISRILS